MLRAAKRPVVYAGQGVVLAGCEREVQLLAARLGAPVVTSIKARGVLSERDPLCFGLYHFEGCEELLREADLCLALGTGFGQFATSYYKAPIPENLIQVDVDPQRLGRNYPAALGILADAREALQGLLKRLEDMGEAPLGEGHVRVRAGRRLYAERLAAFLARPQAPPFHGLFVMKTLREAFPPETIFLSDSSATQSWLMEQAFEIYRPRSLLLSEAYQSMGYALGAAIGARLGAPERPVCAIIGDGSFTMVCGELATATALGLPITFLIFNDGKYGALRHSQTHVFGGRYIGTDLNDPDFPALAEAFGARGHKVTSAEGLRGALAASLQEGGVHVVDCPIAPDVLSTRWERAAQTFRAAGKAGG
ncbi:MAG: thiamine pyrophosphate-binding protein [Candidatus Tectomicrobia bacterium]|nr:thiamine pyrophosphate-binding protein [Candidatus Tectomicrobia bacterium]